MTSELKKKIKSLAVFKGTKKTKLDEAAQARFSAAKDLECIVNELKRQNTKYSDLLLSPIESKVAVFLQSRNDLIFHLIDKIKSLEISKNSCEVLLNQRTTEWRKAYSEHEAASSLVQRKKVELRMLQEKKESEINDETGQILFGLRRKAD
ncbi:hypothetical protein I3271_03280 [Photobacterium leiognathi]|uniref:flagellar FliJ family protein n=1 Tax=Photobacterium leiognathi TaxID=553611 RepID=UPI001EE079B0|nr:flagellar FliJ family protein [Photobacterium leiognathi]MCG3883704.1 hypothetical protein [Photobacterium leiognathi]